MTDRPTLIITAEDEGDQGNLWIVRITWGAIALAVVIFWAAMIALAFNQ